MSDRGEWDPWDFGEPDPAWDEPDPYDVGPEDPDDLDERDGGAPTGPSAPRGALLAALGVMLVLAVAIAAVVLRGDDDGGDDDGDRASEEVETDDDPPRSTSSSSSSTSSTTVVEGTDEGTPDVSGSTSSTRARSATTRPGATTSTTTDDGKVPDCGHSPPGRVEDVPEDWRDRWQSMPRPNDPARISICIDDVTPRVGQRVEVTLRADDPDAVIVQDECGYQLLWEGEATGNTCRDALVPHDGPRPTPLQEPGHVIVRFTHVYGSPGQRTIFGNVISSRWEGYQSPYASYAEATLRVTVQP